MNKLLNIYKPVGVTPLEVISQLRKEYPEYKDMKIGYAGRLDPLAHGVLLLMVGEAARERDNYLGLDKEYVFEALFGMSTDTYDILGEILDAQSSDISQSIVKEKVNIFVNNHIKTFSLPYPPYSSKTVNGKPLFWWSRQNRLSEIAIPERTITISAFSSLSFASQTSDYLKKYVSERIGLVKGDFRQETVLARWDKILTVSKAGPYLTAKFRISCSSGTYVRSLIHDMGQDAGTGAIALDILRTRAGEHTLDKAIKLKSFSSVFLK